MRRTALLLLCCIAVTGCPQCETLSDAGPSPIGDAADSRDAGDAADAGSLYDAGNAMPPDGGRRDASPLTDAAFLDAGRADAAATDAAASDAAIADAALPCFAPSSIWPGTMAVTPLDDEDADIGNDASGLVWTPFGDDVLWLVENAPSRLHRLVTDVTSGRRVHDLGWGSPRDLTFGAGARAPDSEGVTLGLPGDPAVYVASERDVLDGMVSRLSVLRFDVSSNMSPLEATMEWDLTADLASAGVIVEPNGGLESISFIPDERLAGRLHDYQTGGAYSPNVYGPHYGGVFVVGIEQTGDIAFYVLSAQGAATRLALIDSGLGAIMALEADRTSGTLWAGCDSTCNNAYAVLSLPEAGASSGDYVVRDVFFGPSGLPALDHEAFALGPRTEGERTVFWAADGAAPGEIVHRGAVNAAAVCPPQ